MEWISVDDYLPMDDYDMVCFIAFNDGHKAVSNGGTVCQDIAKQIGWWMPLRNAVGFLPSPPQTITEAEQIEEVRKGRT